MGQKTVIILSILLLSSALFAEKKTLYIKNFTVTSGFSKPEGIAIGQDIKIDMSDVINKTNRFSIVSDSEVQESLKAIEEQQQLGCDTESCMRQVMKAVQSDYLIYGTLRKRTYDGKFILSGTLMDRSKGSITIGRNKRIEFDDIKKDFRNSINQLALYLIGEKQEVTEIHTLTASERNSRGFKALRGFLSFPEWDRLFMETHLV